MLSYAPWLSISKGILLQIALANKCSSTRGMVSIMRPPLLLTLLFVEKSYFSLDYSLLGTHKELKEWELCQRIVFVYYNNNISKGFINDRFNTWKDAPPGEFLISLPNY